MYPVRIELELDESMVASAGIHLLERRSYRKGDQENRLEATASLLRFFLFLSMRAALYSVRPYDCGGQIRPGSHICVQACEHLFFAYMCVNGPVL